jgi:outer membrane receptor protein involved in Fe transport
MQMRVILAVFLFAQTTASLTGVVSAADGQKLAGVTVTIESPALQGSRIAVTNEAGVYEFAALPPGEYKVTFTLTGTAEVSKRTRTQLAELSRVDAVLRFGESDNITVRADRPTAIESPEVATNFTLREIEQLPVQRNQLATAQLAPGVTANTLGNGELSISGGPGYDNLALVNGVVVTENLRSQMRPMYVEDAIQETTVLTGAISAEYGRFTGGVISTITKSGGNQFSGSLRDSLSNPAWSEQTPAKEDRTSALNHVWEGTLGGFVKPDRIWFFGAGRRAKNDTARQTIAIPAFTSAPASPASPQLSYNEGNDQRRYEAKVTGRLAPSQSLVASIFRIATRTKNSRFGNSIYDTASFTSQSNPDSLVAAHYDGVFAQDVLFSGHYSKRKFGLQSGALTTDIVAGTVLLDRANANTRFNAPSLCAICGVEQRNNHDAQLSASHLAATRWGTHDLVAGADRFEEERIPNNHQSGSDFLLFVTRVQYLNGAIYPVITPTSANGGNTFIRWSPILNAAQPNHLRTDSLFVNDRWNLNSHFSFNAGARFDRNHAVDADGTLTSSDRRISPRLAAQYDIHSDGQRRVNASYSIYSSRVVDAIASSNQIAGNALSVDFSYKGPAINDKSLTISLPDAIRSVLGTFTPALNNPSLLRPNGLRTVPGYSTYFDGTLASPSVRELTLGYAQQLGSQGFVRVDLIDRDWRDFYAAGVTQSTRHVTTPLGLAVDLALERNSNNVQRTYRGAQLQGRWNATFPLSTGIDYTYSKLRGNDDGETAQAGPIANSDPSIFYPEFLNYANFSPRGWLQGDERHRLRAWANYDILPSLSVALLWSFDSGQPYSAVAPINVTRYTGAPATGAYNAVPNGQYYFSQRGAFRTDDISSTNLAVRYTFHHFFAQGDLLNVFNRSGVADPTRLATTVSTAATSSVFAVFNPFTQTPIQCPTGAAASVCQAMGANYQLATNFGQPQSELAYQTPRTVRLSMGVRF